METSGTARFRMLDADAVVAHGLTTRARLAEHGVPTTTIDRWLRSGLLQEAGHPGVYRHAGAPVTPLSLVLAAVLAVGPSAVASHASALRVWGLWSHRSGDVDVAVDARNRTQVDGVRLHHTRRLDDDECRTHAGVPVTSVARAICDVARYVHPRVVRDLLADGASRDLVSPEELHACVDRRKRFPGRTAVRAALLGFDPEQARFLSKLERVGRRGVVDDGLPAPRVNFPAIGASGTRWPADLAWPEVCYDAEIDGPAHAQPSQQRRDRRRDADLHAAGWVVDRFSEDETRAGAHVAIIRARLTELGHPALR